MSEIISPKKPNGLFLVWKKYQRRPEVLAALTNCELRFIPHLFKSKYLRPLDYLFKLLSSVKDIVGKRPDFIIAQCPPTFSALPALITRTPYVIDGHNPLFQVKMWQTLPLAQTLIKNSAAIIVHNAEMFQMVNSAYPAAKLFTISDPIKAIVAPVKQQRLPKQILVIASFDPWDEPVDLLIESMATLTEYQFVITADVSKLDSGTAAKLQKLTNVILTGFLSTEKYHQTLCSSLAALVLTTSNATQPSGACEALSSNTQLVISKTSLTEKLFGQWAELVDNSAGSIACAIRSLSDKELDLANYRQQWNTGVEREIEQLTEYLQQYIVES